MKPELILGKVIMKHVTLLWICRHIHNRVLCVYVSVCLSVCYCVSVYVGVCVPVCLCGFMSASKLLLVSELTDFISVTVSVADIFILCTIVAKVTPPPL